MPICKNDNKRYYKGTETSPRGLGYSAQVMKVGSKKTGKDGNMWIVKEIKDGSLRWMKFKTKEDYKIVDVSESNLKKYKLEADIVKSARDILLILKKKDRDGVFLVKNNVIIGFYHLLLEPILQLVFINISKKYRGQRLCNKLIDHLTKYITKNDIKLLKIVNAGGLSALKCYSQFSKLNYNIFYKNEKNVWVQINKEKLIKIGKKMIDHDDWMEILFIKPGINIAKFKNMIN